MTDVVPDSTTTIPPLLKTLVHDYAQKGLTIVSVWLMGHGATQYIHVLSQANGQSDSVFVDSVIQTGVGLVLMGVSCAWTYISAYLRKKKMTTLLNANPAT